MMKYAIISIALLAASPLSAACYADYKAKKGSPLQLHYGVIEVPDDACNAADSAAYVSARISEDGWQLLNVISVFDESGLSSRQAEAGDYYLRF